MFATRSPLRRFRLARSAAAVTLLLSLLVPSLASAQETDLLQVGGREVMFPVLDGYVSVGEAEPKLHELLQASLPPSNRLVVSYMLASDIDLVREGKNNAGFQVLVQAVRPVEHTEFDDKAWAELLPQLSEGMGKIDAKALLDKQSSSSSERMGDVAGTKIEMEFGEIKSPTVYQDDGESVRFMMNVPVKISVGGDEPVVVDATTTVAAAFTRVQGRLLLVYVFSPPDLPDGFEATTGLLDTVVTRMYTLNR